MCAFDTNKCFYLSMAMLCIHDQCMTVMYKEIKT